MTTTNTLIRSDVTDPEIMDWVGRVTALAPLIEQYRDQADQQRVTSAEVMDQLRAAGLHRMMISKEFGGGQVSLSTGIAVVQAWPVSTDRWPGRSRSRARSAGCPTSCPSRPPASCSRTARAW